MAQPVTARFGKFIVSLESEDSPNVFVAPCGFTSKSLVMGKNLSEISIPDCDDPDLPIWLGRDVQSNTASITGQGVFAAESVERWLAAYESNESVECQVEVEFSTGVLLFQGHFHLETWTLGAEQGGRVTIDVSMPSDGEITGTWTPTP
jgi:hypothetical protein